MSLGNIGRDNGQQSDWQFGVDGLLALGDAKTTYMFSNARARFSVSHSGRLPWSSPTHAVRQIMAPLIGKTDRRGQVPIRGLFYFFNQFCSRVDWNRFRSGKHVRHVDHQS